MRSTWLRALMVWAGIMAVETMHGILRAWLLEPWLGGFRARQLSVVTASILIFAMAVATVRWIGAGQERTLLKIGALWVGLTVSFEFGLGMGVLGFSWARMMEDYDLTRGGFLAFGMIGLWLSPLLATRLRAGL